MEPEQHKCFIEPTELIPDETALFLSDYTTQQISLLFRPSPSDERVVYCWEQRCATCAGLHLNEGSKTKFFQYLRYVHRKLHPPKTENPYRQYYANEYECGECQRKRNFKLKEDAEVKEASLEEAQIEYTENYLRLYISSDRAWAAGSNLHKCFCQIRDGFYSHLLKRENVIREIKTMDYYEFLETPFWKAIAFEVKRRAGFKCAVCGKNNRLAAHHRTYTIRGHELDAIGKDLTCLCVDCHGTFHKANEVAK